MLNAIETYIKILKEYNEHTNIYSKKSYETLDFHIQDSITLASIITDTPLTLFDFGSGSGLPAIPIAITNPQNTLYLIESKSRKTKFLNHVKNELNLSNITIITKNLFEWIPPVKPQIITAKAFSHVSKVEQITKKMKLGSHSILIPISAQQKITYSNDPSLSFIEKNDYIYLKKTT